MKVCRGVMEQDLEARDQEVEEVEAEVSEWGLEENACVQTVVIESLINLVFHVTLKNVLSAERL